MPESTLPAFPPAKAQTLIAIARSAPLQSMDQADARRQLLEEFAGWYNSLLPKAAGPTPAAE